MIFGIDFGTSYTVVAWIGEDKALHFLEAAGAKLIPTQIDGLSNIKRIIAENSANIHLNKLEVYKSVKKFFANVAWQLEQETGVVDIKDVVVTVPVRFDDLARNAIKSAAIAAGFNVLKLLAEPVAAAIYSACGDGYYVVYDLGGGTFDATLLKLEGDVFQVLAVDGLKDYGGIDIDKILAQRSLEYKHVGQFTDVEKADIEASLEKTYKIIFNLLASQDVKKEEIKQLILAGGSTRLAMIRQKLSRDFNVMVQDIEPDLLVGAGAAQHAFALAHDSHMLIDVVPYNLGIEVLGDGMEVLIPKNSAIPCSKTEYFIPVNNKVLIKILQGVSEIVSECSVLASFEIESQREFPVVFMLDCDGILSVKIADEVFIVSAIKAEF